MYDFKARILCSNQINSAITCNNNKKKNQHYK